MNNLLPVDGTMIYYPDFFKDKLNVSYWQQLEGLSWKSDVIKMFGKTITTKRKVGWYGDEAYTYIYSKTPKTAANWPPILLEIRKQIQASIPVHFNCCLTNLYQDGSVGMGWHSDDEPEMLNNGVIASASFGETRRIHFKHKLKRAPNVRLDLEPLSLLLMKGETQTYWQHQISATKKVNKPRVNLTFRQFNLDYHASPN